MLNLRKQNSKFFGGTPKGRILNDQRKKAENGLETYNYLYLLDSEKFRVYFFTMVCPGIKKNHGHTRPKTLNKKNRKMTIFKANSRLVKIAIVEKSY
jgi:hypothetical protein